MKCVPTGQCGRSYFCHTNEWNCPSIDIARNTRRNLEHRSAGRRTARQNVDWSSRYSSQFVLHSNIKCCREPDSTQQCQPRGHCRLPGSERRTAFSCCKAGSLDRNSVASDHVGIKLCGGQPVKRFRREWATTNQPCNAP